MEGNGLGVVMMSYLLGIESGQCLRVVFFIRRMGVFLLGFVGVNPYFVGRVHEILPLSAKRFPGTSGPDGQSPLFR